MTCNWDVRYKLRNGNCTHSWLGVCVQLITQDVELFCQMCFLWLHRKLLQTHTLFTLNNSCCCH